LREGLPKHGLSAPTAHVGLLRGDADAILDLAAELGITRVIDPAVTAERWTSVDDIAATAEQLNAAAQKAAERGLKVGYHNHWWELETDFDGKHGLEVLADHLAPEVVLEVDTYWAYVGGADVPALLNRLGDRVVALHVKDGDGTRDNKKQVAVGSGVIPVWDFIAAAPDALRVVELDDSEGDRVEAIRASRDYLLAGDAR
jgi:sugar phosphate isomerase/epimerase